MTAQGYSVYLDDAGHPVDQPYLVLGGFIASDARWIEFGRAWSQILKSRRLDAPFHGTDFFTRHKNDPKLKHITADLVRPITNYVEGAFSVGLDMEVYKRVNREKRLEECAGSPITLISRCLRERVDEWMALKRYASPVIYFIESGTFQRGDMMEVWKHLDKELPPQAVPKSHPSTQAADLYAYSVFQSGPSNHPNWQHEMFAKRGDKTFTCFDTRVMESDMETYLSRPSTVINGQRVRIPGRSETEGASFEIEGNKNKQQSARRAKIGL